MICPRRESLLGTDPRGHGTEHLPGRSGNPETRWCAIRNAERARKYSKPHSLAFPAFHPRSMRQQHEPWEPLDQRLFAHRHGTRRDTDSGTAGDRPSHRRVILPRAPAAARSLRRRGGEPHAGPNWHCGEAIGQLIVSGEAVECTLHQVQRRPSAVVDQSARDDGQANFRCRVIIGTSMLANGRSRSGAPLHREGAATGCAWLVERA